MLQIRLHELLLHGNWVGSENWSIIISARKKERKKERKNERMKTTRKNKAASATTEKKDAKA